MPSSSKVAPITPAAPAASTPSPSGTSSGPAEEPQAGQCVLIFFEQDRLFSDLYICFYYMY